MSGHCFPLAINFLFSAKIVSDFHSRQIISPVYTSRLYKYISIYNQYSDTISLICPAKIIPKRRSFQIFQCDVRACPFRVRPCLQNVHESQYNSFAL